MKSFEFQPLESRLLFTAPPPGSVISAANRQTFLTGMTLSASLKSSLQAKLTANDLAGFDTQLLGYMRTRSGAGAGKFYFDDADAASYGTYITTNIGDGGAISRGDNIKAHLFPQQGDATTYTVQLPIDIDWDNTAPSSNPEFIHTLNRMNFWMDLSQAFRFTGSTTYVTEMINQLSSWSQQFPTVTEPATFSDADKKGWLLDTSMRVESWSWSYFQVLASSAWSKEANSLFLYKLQQQGTYLTTAAPYPTSDNRSISQAKGILFAALAFPELTSGTTWRTKGQDLLTSAIDGQLYDDGSHREQSPGYAASILDDVLETKLLYATNGVAFPSAYNAKINNGLSAYYQFLSPDGKRPAIGDAYRNISVTLFLKANLTQNVSTYPAGKPRGRDVWLFGPTTVDPYLGNPIIPPLGDRGKTFPLPDSGNYIARSGSDASARQFIFDAGPKGGNHGHFDLLSFELFGYGAPLISDPGLLRYDNSSDRKWAVSTPAHNTISIDNVSTGSLDDDAGIVVDQWTTDANHAQVTAHHHGYGYLSGRPVVGRSIWYDLDGTMLVVDWGESLESHEFTTSFLLPGTSQTSNLPAGTIRTTNVNGNVKIQTLLQTGQTAFKENRFTSSNPPPNEKDAAVRYLVRQSGTFVVFATLISAYNGASVPDTTAQLLSTPTAGNTFQIRLTKGGVDQDVTFAPPVVKRLNANATSNGSYSDLAYDKLGNLHLVYYDRDSSDLKYTMRSTTTGKWSIVETIDNDGPFIGFAPSIAIDSKNHVGVSYTAANIGDLKYAFNNGNNWTVTTVDAKGSTGHYSSLAFSRNDGPVITYYDKTKGDLRMATSAGTGFALTTIDSGSVGTKDVGRFSSLVLDPDRPTASKWAIAYEDTGGGRYRYAIQGALNGGEQLANGYTLFNIDTTVAKLGGYTSLAFDSANRPTVSFYSSLNSGLKFAKSSGSTLSGGINFTSNFVVTKDAVGYYSQLYYDTTGKANILYFDRTHGLAMRVRNTSGNTWTQTTLAPGGRELHVARFGSTLAYTNLNEAVPSLEVLF